MNPSKKALVTGASRGIGEAIARRLSADGWRVILHANRSAERLYSLAEEIGAEQVCFADLSDKRAVLRLADEVGAVDVLVNNAAVAASALLQEQDEAVIDELLAVDLVAPIYLTRALIPAMIHSGAGSIVNVSSIWGQTGASMECVYSAAKAGLIGFTKALAKELAPSGVRVNCVCPGVVDTDMMSAYTEEEKRSLAEEIPLLRFGRAQEIAEAVGFLAGDRASYITGQIFAVNGGMLI